VGLAQSVASIGSHTTRTLSSVLGVCFKISWTADAPRRQVLQEGEKSSTRRKLAGAALNAR
jgi:hypothetical protein